MNRAAARAAWVSEVFEYLGGKKERRDRALSKFITEILPLADNESIPGTKKTAVEAEIISFVVFSLVEQQ